MLDNKDSLSIHLHERLTVSSKQLGVFKLFSWKMDIIIITLISITGSRGNLSL